MARLTRRELLTTASGLGLAAVTATSHAGTTPPVSFFLVGDTHYLANRERPQELDSTSRVVTSRLVDWLNRLPGLAIPEEAGGGTVNRPRGVIHAGDLIDSGDKAGALYQAMQQTEWRAFEEDYGLTGRDGRLHWPVYEVHGNHDSPRGDGLVVAGIRRRNRQRPGLAEVSGDGLHYSWDWGPVHFVNLGIVVGPHPEVMRRRRYAPLDSLPFLAADLRRHAHRPVILTHHVDVARYSLPCDATAAAGNHEWDPCDVRGYYELIRGHNVLGVLYGHTHVRNVFRWDGTRVRPAEGGLPVFNTDNASHSHDQAQAFFYFEVTDRELIAREFATRDAWRTGAWTPHVWRVPLPRG